MADRKAVFLLVAVFAILLLSQHAQADVMPALTAVKPAMERPVRLARKLMGFGFSFSASKSADVKKDAAVSVSKPGVSVSKSVSVSKPGISVQLG